MKKTYIEFLNKDKNFKKDRIYFEGEDSYTQAVKWGKENLSNFNSDMVFYDVDFNKVESYLKEVN